MSWPTSGGRGSRLPRTFWVLWVGTVVLRLGAVIQPFLAYHLHQSGDFSPAAVGGILAVIGAGGVLSQVVGGALADAYGRRRTMTLSVFLAAGTLIALASAHSTWAILGCGFALGLTIDMYRPASQALVADVVAPAERARAFGLLVWAVNLGFAVAMIVSGALAAQGFATLCYANAAACVCFGAVASFALPETRPAATRQAPTSTTTLRSDRAMICFLVAMTVYSVVFMQAFSTLPLAMEADHVSPTVYGAIMAANGAVIIALQPMAMRLLRPFDHHRVLAAGIAVVGVGYAATAFASRPGGYLAGVVVWSLGEIIVYALATTIVVDASPARARGRYLGAYGMTWSLGSMLAPLVGTTVLARAGAAPLWFGAAVACAVAAIMVLALAPRMRGDRS